MVCYGFSFSFFSWRDIYMYVRLGWEGGGGSELKKNVGTLPFFFPLSSNFRKMTKTDTCPSSFLVWYILFTLVRKAREVDRR